MPKTNPSITINFDQFVPFSGTFWMLKTVHLAGIKDALLKNIEGDATIDSFEKALKEAVISTTGKVFNLSEQKRRNLVEKFDGFLTALRIQTILKRDIKYKKQAEELDEIWLFEILNG